jgi:hypothetical protein
LTLPSSLVAEVVVDAAEEEVAALEAEEADSVVAVEQRVWAAVAVASAAQARLLR